MPLFILTFALLPVLPTHPLLDAAQIKPGVSVFQMKFQGEVAGTSRFETEKRQDTIVFTETSKLERFNVDAVNVSELDAGDLSPKAFRATGSMFGRAIDIAVQWEGGKASGTSDFPRTPDKPQGKIDIARDLPETIIERTSVFFLVPAMPVDKQKEWKFDWYNTYDDSITTITAKVNGEKTVTVPAGTFDTWRVELTGGQPSQIVYITKESPRRMVMIEVVETPWVYELLPE
jgi:hypothetical protein